VKLAVAFSVALVVLSSWDMLANNGKYRREMARMAGYISTSFHLR
jgi:hypothetical protein